MNRKCSVLAAFLLLWVHLELFGQTAALRFEVASIKPVEKPDPRSGTGFVRPLPGGRLSARDALLKTLVQVGYNVRRYQIQGGPDWIDSARFDIEAAAEPDAPATPGRIASMLQNLLEERFKLKVRREIRELPVYDLSAAKGGLKLAAVKAGGCVTPTPGNSPAPPPPGQAPPTVCGVASVRIGPGGGHIYGGKVQMTALAATLSNMLGRTVIDRTGFIGIFDVALDFAPDQSLDGLTTLGGPALPLEGTGVTIFTALQEQLGLKLDSTRGPVEVLVIESVERPTPN